MARRSSSLSKWVTLNAIVSYRGYSGPVFRLADGFHFKVTDGPRRIDAKGRIARHSELKWGSRVGAGGKLVICREVYESLKPKYNAYRSWMPGGLSVSVPFEKEPPERIMFAPNLYPESGEMFKLLPYERPRDQGDYPSGADVVALYEWLWENNYEDVASVVMIQHTTGMYAEEVCGFTSKPDSYRQDDHTGTYGTRIGDLFYTSFAGTFKGELWITARFCDSDWKAFRASTSVKDYLTRRWAAMGGLRMHPGCHFTLCTIERYKSVMCDTPPIWGHVSSNNWWHYNTIGNGHRKKRLCKLSFNQPTDSYVHKSQYEMMDIQMLEDNGVPFGIHRGIVYLHEAGNEYGVGYAPSEHPCDMRAAPQWGLEAADVEVGTWGWYPAMRLRSARWLCYDQLPTQFRNKGVGKTILSQS